MSRPDELSEAEEFFHQQIPLTRAMGLRVTADESGGFAVEAPVALNYNHLHTAFGGSINAVATLAGYGVLWVGLRNDGAHFVIRESRIRFLRPIRETIRAVCEQPDPKQMEELRLTFRAKGKARITLQVRVEESGITAASFEGLFVALKVPTKN